MRLRWVTLLVVGSMLGCGNGSHGGGDGGAGSGGEDGGAGNGGEGGGGGGTDGTCSGGTYHNAGELAALADCLVVSGAIDITGADWTEVSLPKLARAARSITIHDAANLTSVALPALTESGDLTFDGVAKLATLDLSALAHVKGNLWLGSRTVVTSPLPALDKIKLPALETVDERFHVVEVYATELSAPKLASTGAVVVQSTFLSDLALPALTNIAGPLQIDFNRTLGHIDLGAVTSINGAIFIRGNGRFSTALDTHLDLHSLAQATDLFDLAGNGLSTLQLDKLESVHAQLSITGNELVELRVPALITVSGNLYVAHNLSLPSVLAFPALSTVGGVVILGTPWNLGACTPTPNRDLPSSYSVSLPALTGTRGLSVCDERGLTDVSMPKVPAVQFSIAVAAAPELTALRLDGLAMIGNRLIVIDNPELKTLTEAVTAVDGHTPGQPAVVLQRNPNLGCRAAALVTASGSGGFAISGNSATCATP